MKKYIAVLGVVVATGASTTAWSAVVTGTAANVPAAEVSGARTALAHASEAGNGPLAPSLQGKPVVVRIHADWCTACKATRATLSDLRQAYAGRVHFVEFNVTNAKTAAAAHAEAEKLGLTKFYDAAKAQTSTVAVINPQDGKVLATFYNDGNLQDYEGAVNQALKVEKAAG